MIAYLDSSVILRMVLGESGRLREWGKLRAGVASALVEVECLRTLDRLSLRGKLGPGQLAARRETVYRLMNAIDIIELSPGVLHRAGQPFPTPLGTLDAIHLASALAYRESREPSLLMATHDGALAAAAVSCGISVIGAGQA